MRVSKSAVAFVASMFAAMSSAFAAAGTLTAKVVPLVDNVTYSVASPTLDTYLALTVGVTNSGSNTINRIKFTVTARATDPAETVALFNSSVYLPSSCVQTAPSTFACTAAQLRSGASVSDFVVFYKAPVKVVDGTGIGDASGSDTVSVDVHLDYAEGTNDQPSGGENSADDQTFADLVVLGTTNQISIKSAIPKGGGTLHTGAGGIPSGGNKLTELVEIPPLNNSTFTTALIDVSKVPDSSSLEPQCGNLGHFRECPLYTTTISGDFLNSPWLKTIYRIDATNLKMSPAKILNSVEIRYTGENFTNELVNVCPITSTPLGTGLPCILSSQCYKRSTLGWTPELDGDCEWVLINTKNGLIKIF